MSDRAFDPDRPRATAPSRAGWGLAAAAAITLCAAVVRLQTRQAEREHPPRGHFVTVRGVRLHYLDFGGEGQPLVMLHGNGLLAQDFEISGLVALAQSRYRVLAFDRPGYGYSDRPAGPCWTAQAQAELLHEALQQLGVRDPVVLGHSLGTQVALAMGLRHPQSLRALVLLSGYYFPTLRPEVPWLSAPALPVLGTLLRHTVSPLLARLMWPAMRRRLFSPEAPTPRFRWLFPLGLMLRPSHLQATAAERALMIPNAARMARHYRALSVPVVVMSGDGDRLVSPAWQTLRLQRRLPDSRLSVVQGAGHMLHHVAPAEVLEAIDAATAMAGSAVPAVQRVSVPPVSSPAEPDAVAASHP